MAITYLLDEISRYTFESQGLESLGNDNGIFLLVEDTVSGDLSVLAKVPDHAVDAVRQLLEIAVDHDRPSRLGFVNDGDWKAGFVAEFGGAPR